MKTRPHLDANLALAKILGEKLDVPGNDLPTIVARAGRALPRRMRCEASVLIEAEKLSAHPKLRHLADDARTVLADKRLRAYARRLDPDKDRTDRRLGWLAGLAFNFLLFAALLVAVLYWRGFVGPTG